MSKDCEAVEISKMLSVRHAPPHLGTASPALVSEFIRATYRVFLSSLALMTALGLLSYYFLPRSSIFIIGAGDSLIWIACGWFGWRNPIALTFGLFVLATGLLLGQVAHFQPHLITQSALISLLTFVGLSGYVHLTLRTFSFLRASLWVSLYILIGGGLMLPFSSGHIVETVLACLGTLVFAGWVLYDTGRMIERADEELTPAVAAFELILDLVGLRSWIDALLGERE